MSWWWSKSETGSPYERGDAFYDESIRLSHTPGREPEAERAALAAVSEFRALLARTRGTEARRRLAKALWRQSSATALLLGRPADALEPGREGIALAKQVLDETTIDHPAYDAIVLELAVAMNDLAQTGALVGRLPEREQLLVDACEIAKRSSGIGGRQALGTSLHNLADHKFQQMHDQPSNATKRDLDATLAAAEQALVIRNGLCAEPNPQHYFFTELANSSLQLGILLCYVGHRARGLEMLARAPDALRSVSGASVDSLRQRLRQELKRMREMDAVLSARDAAVSAKTPARELGQAASVLLHLLCILEPPDRIATLVKLWLPDLWVIERLPVPAPDFDAALAELVAAGIVSVQPVQNGSCYEITEEHVCEVRERLPAALTEPFLGGVSHAWAVRYSCEQDAPGPHTVRAGIAGSVYQRRLGNYALAFDMLEKHVLGTACRTGESKYVVAHMRITADDSKDPALATRFDVAAERLATAHLVEGQCEEALETARIGIEHAIERDLGLERIATWHERKLQLLYGAGRYADLLTCMADALEFIDAAAAHVTDQAAHQLLRERVLHHAAGAAKGSRLWQRALSFSRLIAESMEQRGASAHERAHYRVGDYAALLELGDADAAEDLLRQCQQEFERSNDTYRLALTLGGRGIVASRRGDFQAALRLKRSSLKCFYETSGHVLEIASAHDVYANELARLRAEPRECGAHWLAAAVIFQVRGRRDGSAAIVSKLKGLVGIAGRVVPNGLEELVAVVERNGDARLGALLPTLNSDPHAVSVAAAQVMEALNEPKP